MMQEYFEKKKNSIRKVLNKAIETPYYTQYLKNIDLDNLTYEQYSKIPILDKKTLNLNMLDMLTNKYSGFEKDRYVKLPYEEKRAYLENFDLELRVTSGSTGIPIEVIKSKEDIKRDYITLNWRRRKMTSYNFEGNFVWIWPVNPIIRKYFYPDSNGNAFWRVNKYGTQYMLNEYSYNNFMTLSTYIINNKVEWITSSPSCLIHYIDFLEANNILLPQIKYIECHSEYLYSWQRKKISSFFKCEIVNIYSSNEVQFMGGTKISNEMTIFQEACFLEIVKNEVGVNEIIVTALNYLDVPIIRYKLGDCAEWIDSEKNSAFKIKLNKFRENDFIVGKNGNKFEPFIITDSIVMLKNMFNLEINMYRVQQVKIDTFYYYFEKEIYIEDDSKCIEFLENYLGQLLKYQIHVFIVQKSINDFTYYGTKLKYFEVNKDLLES